MLEPTPPVQPGLRGLRQDPGVREHDPGHAPGRATCLQAVEECGAPDRRRSAGASRPSIPTWTSSCRSLLRRKKFIYLCTNAIKLEKFLRKWTPSPRLTINVSMDGLEPTHDLVRLAEGAVSDRHPDDQAGQVARLPGGDQHHRSTRRPRSRRSPSSSPSWPGMGVDGFLVTPGYEYTILKGRDMFLEKQQTHEKFQRIWELSKQYRILSTPHVPAAS
ncbi:MAG: hypothetical protein M0C28_11645 [Candidatus Moduliflexus flocculans]|nr:hypothetical protein [Candidatus Moduliflexus flocculans]